MSQIQNAVKFTFMFNSGHTFDVKTALNNMLDHLESQMPSECKNSFARSIGAAYDTTEEKDVATYVYFEALKKSGKNVESDVDYGKQIVLSYLFKLSPSCFSWLENHGNMEKYIADMFRPLRVKVTMKFERGALHGLSTGSKVIHYKIMPNVK